MSLNELAEQIFKDNKNKGFYDGTPRTPLESHMLIVSEVSEATEAVRSAEPAFWYEGDKPQGEQVELADALIRILDYCAYRGWDVEQAVTEKLAYNRTRPHKHGKTL